MMMSGSRTVLMPITGVHCPSFCCSIFSSLILFYECTPHWDALCERETFVLARPLTRPSWPSLAHGARRAQSEPKGKLGLRRKAVREKNRGSLKLKLEVVRSTDANTIRATVRVPRAILVVDTLLQLTL
jgi:hypothetical protein